MLILASASPRRRDLLAQIGCSFQVQVSSAAEEMSVAYEARDLVLLNARRKAEMVGESFPDMPILGADTVVSLAGKVYGKPGDAADARIILQQLSGRTHEVRTGLALLYEGQLWQASAVTEVEFSVLTEKEITWYIDTGEPFGKAGAYAVQGKAAIFIKGIKGSFSNVVGLPLYELAVLAQKAGVDLYGNDGQGFTS